MAGRGLAWLGAAWRGEAGNVSRHVAASRRQFRRTEAPPLLFNPLDPDLARQPREARKFVAHRSLRDVEPTVNLWLRNPEGFEVEGSGHE